MEQKHENMRERLLARFPQPENLAAYREETAALLAKHEKALFWEKATAVHSVVVVSIAAFMVNSLWAAKLGTTQRSSLRLALRGTPYCCRSDSGPEHTLSHRSKVDSAEGISSRSSSQMLELQAVARKERRTSKPDSIAPRTVHLRTADLTLSVYFPRRPIAARLRF